MRDPKEILDTIRCHLENGNMPAARRAILELQDTLHSLRMTADETRATLVAAIKLIIPELQRLGIEVPEELNLQAITHRLYGATTSGEVLNAFAEILHGLETASAFRRAQAAVVYMRAGPSIEAQIAARRLRRTGIDARGRLHDAIAKMLEETQKGDLPDDPAFENDLRRVADGESHNRMRREIRHGALIAPLADVPEPQAAALQDARVAFNDALASIPLQTLQVLELAHVEGLNDIQIAAALGLHRDTVGHRRRRGEAAFHEALGLT
jgi:DNA-directed RNA polymerase specialized sigma24 family protein